MYLACYVNFMITITKTIEFDSAHRVKGHEGKCRHVHGHRYKLNITLTAESLDGIGRVIDFSEVKEIVKSYIDSTYDHNTIVFKEDSELLERLQGMDRPLAIIPLNPTAENLVVHFYNDLKVLMPSGIDITKMELFETPTSSATLCIK